jgi:uncharacterized protein YggU (UPF0235/DUF167 family)
VKVRVVPRSGRIAVAAEGSRIVIRVRAAPEGGRATEEARKALAAALAVPAADVTLRRGHRSREKAFEVADMAEDEALQRLRGR